MSDLVRKEIHGIFNTNNPREEQVKKNKSSLQEITKTLCMILKSSMFVVIL